MICVNLALVLGAFQRLSRVIYEICGCQSLGKSACLSDVEKCPSPVFLPS